jgi:hypothetical protein
MHASLAHQSIEELGGSGSVLARQRRDHIRLDQLLREVAATTGPDQQAALNKTARLVFPHAFAEESVLWPLARRVLPDAAQLTLQVEQEHQRINELWSHLERLATDDSERDQLLAELTALLRQDVRDEEDELLPRLQDELSTAELRSAGRRWELVRRTAPTRPHAAVSRRPPGNVLAALPLSALDRTRDALDLAARSGPKVLRTGADWLSTRLAAVAGATERAPGMGRGQDPTTARDGR